MSRWPSHPQLALPFTFLTGPDRVRLVAGEDCRFTLEGPALEKWLPAWLATLDGSQALEGALQRLPEGRRETARQLVERLYGERVLVDGPAFKAHQPKPRRLVVEGTGPLRQLLEQTAAEEVAEIVSVLCQDRLDFDEALRFNRRCRAGQSPWFWVTCGPLSRGYVSPAFLPDAGPCLECLVRAFRRLSPLPELYDELIAHAQQGGTIAAAAFFQPAAEILRQIVLAKVHWLARPEAPAALYQLHVVEAATLEVTTHRVFIDPECLTCGRR